MLLYGVTFGGFVGLSSSLTIYFNAEYGLDAGDRRLLHRRPACSPAPSSGRSAGPWPTASAACGPLVVFALAAVGLDRVPASTPSRLASPWR